MIDIKENFSASPEEAQKYLKEILDEVSKRFTKAYFPPMYTDKYYTFSVEFFEPESKLPVPKQKACLEFKVPKNLNATDFYFQIESEAVDYPLFKSVNLNYFPFLLDRILQNKTKMTKNLLLHTNFESTRIISPDGEELKLYTLDEQEDILSDNDGKFFCALSYDFKSLDTAMIDKYIKIIWKTLSDSECEFLELPNFKLLFEYAQFTFSEDNMAKLWKYCDYFKRGKVNYKEFADFCFDFLQCLRVYHLANYKYSNNTYINEKIKSCVEIMNLHFKEYDTEGNSEITFDNLKKCLLKENEIFSRKEIEIILKQINPEKNFEFWKFDRILKILYLNYFDYLALMKEDKIFKYLIKIFEKHDINKTGKLPFSKMKYALLIENKLKLNKVQIIFILYFFDLEEEIDYYKASLVLRDIVAELFSSTCKNQRTEIKLPQYQKFEKFQDVYDEHLKNISNLFIQFDKDYDHLLNEEEFTQFLIWILPFLNEVDFKEIFRITDTDKDGKICFSEYKRQFETIMNVTRVKQVFKEISDII